MTRICFAQYFDQYNTVVFILVLTCTVVQSTPEFYTCRGRPATQLKEPFAPTSSRKNATGKMVLSALHWAEGIFWKNSDIRKSGLINILNILYAWQRQPHGRTLLARLGAVHLPVVFISSMHTVSQVDQTTNLVPLLDVTFGMPGLLLVQQQLASS